MTRHTLHNISVLSGDEFRMWINEMWTLFIYNKQSWNALIAHTRITIHQFAQQLNCNKLEQQFAGWVNRKLGGAGTKHGHDNSRLFSSTETDVLLWFSAFMIHPFHPVNQSSLKCKAYFLLHISPGPTTPIHFLPHSCTNTSEAPAHISLAHALPEPSGSGIVHLECNHSSNQHDE